MDYQLLKTEIDGDSLGRGYAGMSDEEVAVSINDTVDRTSNIASITGDDAFGATDTTEFAGLTDAQKQLWLAWCGRESIDPFQAANVAFVTWVFGAGSTTLTALAALRTTTVSRGAELGFGRVRAGDVEYARTL